MQKPGADQKDLFSLCRSLAYLLYVIYKTANLYEFPNDVNLMKITVMSLEERQQHLKEQIEAIKDESLLIQLEEELDYYINTKSSIKDELAPWQWKELVALSEEDLDKDVITEEEFKKNMEKWRTR
ncbi:MAG: hypothetical protein V4649_04115 [Bacteroidota bacterium]